MIQHRRSCASIERPAKEAHRMSFELHGRLTYRFRNVLLLLWVSFLVTVSRLRHGPRLSEWTWIFETATAFLRLQERVAFGLPTIAKQREYMDALVVRSSELAHMQIEAVEAAAVKGRWFVPRTAAGESVILYLHGGGYAFSVRAHDNLIAFVALATQVRTFALDYRLAPEHPFPAQLEDAQAAYHWLLSSGIASNRIVIAGDSAGGNLALALLLALRDAQQPLPVLAVCLSPWTDMESSSTSLNENGPYDWIEQRMIVQWAEWFCRGTDPQNPLVSPVHADLRGLPPIYIQAGDAELLIDMIRMFVRKAKAQGTPVSLEVWKQMNHVFQAYGPITQQSKKALQRIAEVIQQVRGEGGSRLL
jgi:epsilon-lactone hydrolase